MSQLSIVQTWYEKAMWRHKGSILWCQNFQKRSSIAGITPHETSSARHKEKNAAFYRLPSRRVTHPDKSPFRDLTSSPYSTQHEGNQGKLLKPVRVFTAKTFKNHKRIPRRQNKIQILKKMSNSSSNTAWRVVNETVPSCPQKLQIADAPLPCSTTCNLCTRKINNLHVSFDYVMSSMTHILFLFLSWKYEADWSAGNKPLLHRSSYERVNQQTPGDFSP